MRQTDIITKYDSCVITRCNKSLLQNASASLQNAPGFLLQNVTVITNCDDFMTKLDSYYTKKLWYF